MLPLTSWPEALSYTASSQSACATPWAMPPWTMPSTIIGLITLPTSSTAR